MPKERVSLTIAAVLLGSTLALADQGPFPQTKEELQVEWAKPIWEGVPGTYELTASHSRFHLPAKFALLRGAPARRIMYLTNGTEFPNTEFVVIDLTRLNLVTFDYFDVGYVPDDGWHNLDADEILAGIRAATERGNEDRIRNGLPPLKIKGWLNKPNYDRATRTVYWAIESVERGNSFVNATALRLGRYGYHEVTWIGEDDEFRGGIPTLQETLLARHEYDQGSRYADYVTGDKVAELGIASLVAASTGS